MHEWSAEVIVDRDLARLRLLAEGWDNTVWPVDERWVFRFPRRAVVVAAVGGDAAAGDPYAGVLRPAS